MHQVAEAETKLKGPLERYFTMVWGETYLPSHDLTHHRRVWSYAKEILTIINGYHPPADIPDPEKLITACYFHDSGMGVESGPKHGFKGSEYCLKFLSENGFDARVWDDVVSAIRNHDNKDYSDRTGRGALLRILSVADDLDAFGYTGIYRYAEICLKRGIRPAEIGFMVRNNAEQRFRNFLSFVSGQGTREEIAEFISEHTGRFKVVDSFFSDYDIQVKGYRFGIQPPRGPCGVIEVIQLMLNEKIPAIEFADRVNRITTDPLIIEFWNSFKKEYA